MNKAILIGRAAKDPDIRYTPGGLAVANFTLATSKKWTDKETNKKKEETEWHKITAFEPLSKVIADYVNKGAQLTIVGEIKTRKWQNKEGIDCYTTEIIARELELLGSKKNDESKEHTKNQTPDDEDFEGDIPF